MMCLRRDWHSLLTYGGHECKCQETADLKRIVFLRLQVQAGKIGVFS